MKKIFVICLIICGNVGCKKEIPKTFILIRVENLTNLKLENVRIISYQDAEPIRIEKNYGDIGASEVSGYQQHDLIRSSVEYAYELSDEQKEVSAWCGTSVKYLEHGKYTLQLRIGDGGIIYEEIVRN